MFAYDTVLQRFARRENPIQSIVSGSSVSSSRVLSEED